MGIVSKKAIILAAGLGARLAPMTDECPKPMLPIAGVPLLERILHRFKKHGFKEIGINLHHCPNVVREYFGDGSGHGVSLHYSLEEDLLGTAGALNSFRGFVDQPVLIYYGDVYTEANLDQLWQDHMEGGGMMTIGLYEVDEPTRCGIVDLVEDTPGCERGRITRFVEKPRGEDVFSNLANSGLFVIEPDVLNDIPGQGASDFGHDVIPSLLKQGKYVRGVIIHDDIIDIGTRENFTLIQNRLQGLQGVCE